MNTSDIIQLILIFFTVIGLFLSFRYNSKQIKLLSSQLKLNFFSEYTKRYQEILLNFPENINKDDFDFSKLDNNLRDRTLRYMRAYFDLCSEEYDLHNRNLIDEGVWENWEEGIKYAFSKTAFKQGWEIIKLDTIYYQNFKNWIEKEIMKQ